MHCMAVKHCVEVNLILNEKKMSAISVKVCIRAVSKEPVKITC